MNTFTEVLPARKSSKHSAIHWAPATDNAMSPVAGNVVIDTDSARVTYRIEEFPTGTSARGFLFIKEGKGTDAREPFYTITCRADLPEITGCSCRGFHQFGHCKHADSANSLVANEWL